MRFLNAYKNIKAPQCLTTVRQKEIFKDGKLVYDKPKLDDIRAYVKEQLTSRVWEEEQRYDNPHIHYVDLSKKLYSVKEKMLEAY